MLNFTVAKVQITQTSNFKQTPVFHTFNIGHTHQNSAEQQETKTHYTSSVNTSALLSLSASKKQQGFDYRSGIWK